MADSGKITSGNHPHHLSGTSKTSGPGGFGGRSVSVALNKGKVSLVGTPNSNAYGKDLLRRERVTPTEG